MIFNWPDKQKWNYVIFHLKMEYVIPPEFESFLLFDSEPSSRIEFKISNESLNMKKILKIDGIPVLFPVEEVAQISSLIHGKLVFHHDLIKSAFYLLSGYQEYKATNRDHFHRYRYAGSIQEKLGIAYVPVVNYYFQWIVQGLNQFASLNNLPALRSRRLTEKKSFVFLLTHDVDKIRHYTFNYLIYTVKQLFQFTDVSAANRWRDLRNAVYGLVCRGNDPAWDFDQLLLLEQQYNFKSVFFILDKDLKHQDAYFDTNQPNIQKLIQYLESKGSEIGVHGVCRSSADSDKLKNQIQKLNTVLKEKVSGNRQHRLLYTNPQTLHVHQKAGIRYDSSLCFAEQEGFRNAYCRPFKLFDHEKNQITPVWEFPLNVMDVTLFHYKKYNFEQAYKAIKTIIENTSQFNGIFTLLWHNGFNDELKRPGISLFYDDVLALVEQLGGEGLTGKQLLVRMRQSNK